MESIMKLLATGTRGGSGSGIAHAPGEQGPIKPSPLSEAMDKLVYNHRKYFILGYLVLCLTLLPINDTWAIICFFPTLLSIYYFFKAFALRNVLLLHHQNVYTEARERATQPYAPPPTAGFITYPQQALVLDEDNNGNPSTNDPDDQMITHAGTIKDPENLDVEEPIWEVEENDFIPTAVPSHGITTARSMDPFGSRPGVFYTFGPLKFEQYMLTFVIANILLFGSFFLARIWSDVFCLLGLFSLLLFIGAFVDKWRNGVKLYPIYKDMVNKGLIFDQITGKVGGAHQWFDQYYKKPEEKVLYSDSISLSNWRPHSYTLTNKGIYLEERTGLFAGRKFLYIPLLSLKGMKLTKENYNRTYMYGAGGSLLWAFFITTPGEPFFYFMIAIAVSQFIMALVKTGNQIQGRALNLIFTLSREEDKHLMQDRMIDIDAAYRQRGMEADSQQELQSYAWMEEFPPTPSLKEVKKSVRSAWTGLILPTFFYTMIKLLEIFDQDAGSALFIVMLFGIFALLRIITAIKNVWKYQKYLERPAKQSINLGFVTFSAPELLILVGYLLIALGVANAIINDFLPLAYTQGVLGGILILVGRFFFNSSFRGIDYLDKGSFSPEYSANQYHQFFTDNKRLIVPAIWFVILIILISVTRPYFGESRAEVPPQFLDKNKGNNWEVVDNGTIDLVGLMGMFSLSLRVYEDDGSEGGYNAVLSVMTMRFPVTPSESDMLEEMRKFMAEFSDDQNVNLDEPPEEGVNITTQGYEYQYFIYNGTGQNGTSRFSKGEEIRIMVTAAKIDEEKTFVIAMGMAKVSDGRLIDVELPPPLPPIPNPTDTRNTVNWDELRHDLIPNIRI